MSGPDIVETMSASWRTRPLAVANGRAETGVSAALWTETSPGTKEAEAAPHPTHHAICLPMSRYRAEMRVDGKSSVSGTVKPGSACLIEAGRSVWGVQTGPWTSLHLYVPDGLLSGILDDEGLNRSTVELIDPACRPDPVLAQIGDRCVRAINTIERFSQLQLDTLGSDLAVHLLQRYSNLAVSGGIWSPNIRGGLAPWQLNRACNAMEARLDGDVSLIALAQIVGCSPTHFSRAFKQSTGVPPFQWLLERRIARSKDLLGDPRMPIAEVAIAVGFSAQPQFTTAFKRVTGVTPGAWRRERLF